MPHHLERDRVERHSRSTSTAPESWTVPRHPGSISPVASRPASTAGPSRGTPAASSSNAHRDAVAGAPRNVTAREPRAAPFRRLVPVKRGSGASRTATTRRGTGSTEPPPEGPNRVRWDDDAAYAERVGERASEQRSGTPERHQRHSPGVEAACHAHSAERPRHHGGRDRDDSRGDGGGIASRGVAQRRHSERRGTRVEPHLVRQRARGGEPAQHETGVGDGGSSAPAAIARRPRHRSGALRPHLESAALIDASDTPAPRAHRFDERSEEHTSELQSLAYLVCRLLLEKKNKTRRKTHLR